MFQTILGVKIANLCTFYSIFAFKLPIWSKMVILTSKIVPIFFGIICILMAVKHYTSNFADSDFGPDYCSSFHLFIWKAHCWMWKHIFECPTPMEWRPPVHRSWWTILLYLWLCISDICSFLIGCNKSCDIG